jgi:multidrug efflux system outer membrane protein
MVRPALSLCIALALSGCLLGPDYERPPVATPKDWRFPITKAVVNAANTRWWQQFQDPVLDRLIQVALQENKDVLIAAARVQQFLGRYVVTRADQFPQAAGSALALREKRTTETKPPVAPQYDKAWTYQGILQASYAIDLWGRYRRATEAARAELLASEEARRTVILSLVSAVADSYIRLRTLDRQLQLARLTLDSRREWLRIIKLRYEAGIVSLMEVSQAQSDYESVASTIPDFERQIAREEDNLSILLGRNPGPIRRGRSLDELMLPVVPAGLPSLLLEQRPDVRLAEQQLIAANANIGVAKALFFPSISLTATLGTVSATLSNLFTQNATIWQLGGDLVQPIFQGGALVGNLQIAEAAQQEALYNYLRTVQGAFRDVNDALIDHQKTQEQLDVQARQVQALQDYQRLARLRYDNGYVSYLEVLIADSQLFNAEITFTDSQGRVFQSLVGIYNSLGGGWVDIAETGAARYTGPQVIPSILKPDFTTGAE